MRIGILGSGPVGQTLGKGFLRLGHAVKIGTRDAAKLKAWAEEAGPQASVGTFAEAAEFGEMAVLAAHWSGVENVLRLAEPDRLAGKILIDVTNPLDFSQGPPPRMAVAYPSSGGACVQDWAPQAKVVKAFNIVAASYMVDARLQEGSIDLFIAGNDPAAKAEVAALAKAWHWNSVNDMGEIGQSYLLEAFAMLWIHFGFRQNQWTHAFKLLRK
jgi:8-hydroxy-5-deazaflavin:NADPH oxidoreductase